MITLAKTFIVGLVAVLAVFSSGACVMPAMAAHTAPADDLGAHAGHVSTESADHVRHGSGTAFRALGGAAGHDVAACALECGTSVSKVAVAQKDLGTDGMAKVSALPEDGRLSVSSRGCVGWLRDVGPPDPSDKERLLSVSKKE
jgi:hypothetical protein